MTNLNQYPKSMQMLIQNLYYVPCDRVFSKKAVFLEILADMEKTIDMTIENSALSAKAILDKSGLIFQDEATGFSNLQSAVVYKRAEIYCENDANLIRYYWKGYHYSFYFRDNLELPCDAETEDEKRVWLKGRNDNIKFPKHLEAMKSATDKLNERFGNNDKTTQKAIAYWRKFYYKAMNY